MSNTFFLPIPAAFLKDPEVAEWARQLQLYLNDLSSPTGTITLIESDVDTAEANIATNTANITTIAATVNGLLDSDPTYTVTNGATDRSFDANAAAGAITNPPSQAEVENIRDAVLELADVVGTLIGDLQDENVLG